MVALEYLNFDRRNNTWYVQRDKVPCCQECESPFRHIANLVFDLKIRRIAVTKKIGPAKYSRVLWLCHNCLNEFIAWHDQIEQYHVIVCEEIPKTAYPTILNPATQKPAQGSDSPSFDPLNLGGETVDKTRFAGKRHYSQQIPHGNAEEFMLHHQQEVMARIEELDGKRHDDENTTLHQLANNSTMSLDDAASYLKELQRGSEHARIEQRTRQGLLRRHAEHKEGHGESDQQDQHASIGDSRKA